MRIGRLSSVVTIGCMVLLPSLAVAGSNRPDVRIIDLTKYKDKDNKIAIYQGIPDEVSDAIKNTGSITIIPITGEEKFSQQVIKTDEIVFSPNAKLTLTGLSHPWIAIVAKKAKFNDPKAWTIIQRDPTVSSAPDGGAGSPGPHGPNGVGETNRQGNPGHPGQAGGAGVVGGVADLPTIYFIVGEFIDPNGPIPPGFLNLGFMVSGISGGDGGTGGRGGDGGSGARGKEGSTSLFDCQDGAGRGGRGGDSGQGGRGGDAGAGGNGAELIYVSLETGIEMLSYALVNNTGGLMGRPGRPGGPGAPGLGGRGGRSNGWCDPGPRGDGGDYANPPHHGPGANAPDGGKGTVTGVKVDDIGVFF